MASDGNHFGIAALELSAGRFSVQQVETESDLVSELTRLNPAAKLLISEMEAGKPYFAAWPTRPRPPWHFDPGTATEDLTQLFRTRDLAAFGCEDMPLAIAAARLRASIYKRYSAIRTSAYNVNGSGAPR